MYLTAIVSLSDQQRVNYSKIWNSLKDKGCTRDLFNNYTMRTGYAHKLHRGKVSLKLMELLGRMPTELELSMLCDSGYSHFGGYSNMDASGNFVVKIYTD